MRKTAVIFDLDGTLVDSAPDLMAATNHALGLIGRQEITEAQLRAFVGHGARALIERGVSASGEAVDEATLKYLHAEFLRYYAAHIANHSQIFPGVVAVLQQLKAHGVALGVCTNKTEALSLTLLQALGLLPYFAAVVGPDTIAIAKPDPAPYLETLRLLGVAPENSVMVGDSETDILTARAAGAPSIAVPFGYTLKPVANYYPDYLIQHYDELLPLLKKLKIL